MIVQFCALVPVGWNSCIYKKLYYTVQMLYRIRMFMYLCPTNRSLPLINSTCNLSIVNLDIIKSFWRSWVKCFFIGEKMVFEL